MEKDNGTDLEYLLKNMNPFLEDEELVFCSLAPDEAEKYFPICQGYYCEREGVTLIISRHLADLDGLPYEFVFKRITLDVFSSLGAVGFLARVADVLAAQGFSINVISGYYHDHLYIQSHQAQEAVDTLRLWQEKLSD